jgi:hypothetical protein
MNEVEKLPYSANEKDLKFRPGLDEKGIKEGALA